MILKNNKYQKNLKISLLLNFKKSQKFNIFPVEFKNFINIFSKIYVL